MRTALIQMTSGDSIADNLSVMTDRIGTAADDGAGFVLTPEVCNCVSLDRGHQNTVLALEEDDRTLAGLRNLAAKKGIWLLIGSLALKTGDADGRFANRSFVIDPSGQIVAKYDKIHMFDVSVSEVETFRESAGYRPGSQLVIVPTPFGTLGLTICYDLRFPHIYRALSQAGAEILCIPSAFSPTTGAAHWDPLLRARAIENGAFVLAPAQTGTHSTQTGRARKTYGNSMVVNPWGKVLAKSAQKPDIVFCNLNLAEVHRARQCVPSLSHDRPFEGPQ